MRSVAGFRPLLRLGRKKESEMADILLVITGVLFFIIAAGYARACDRL